MFFGLILPSLMNRSPLMRRWMSRLEIGKLQDEVFCAARHFPDLLPLDLFLEFPGRRQGKRTRPAQVGFKDCFADQVWFKFSCDGFNFG